MKITIELSDGQIELIKLERARNEVWIFNRIIYLVFSILLLITGIIALLFYIHNGDFEKYFTSAMTIIIGLVSLKMTMVNWKSSERSKLYDQIIGNMVGSDQQLDVPATGIEPRLY